MQQLDCSALNSGQSVRVDPQDDVGNRLSIVNINNNNNHLSTSNTVASNCDDETVQQAVATCSVIHVNLTGPPAAEPRSCRVDHQFKNVTNILIGTGDQPKSYRDTTENCPRLQSNRSVSRNLPVRISSLFAGNARHQPLPPHTATATEFVCSATVKNPATFKICGNRLFATKYQESLLTSPIGFGDQSASNQQFRLLPKTRATFCKMSRMLRGQLRPMEFLRLILASYLLVDTILNVLFFFCLDELNELFMQRVRANFGVNPFDCTALQARVGLLTVLLLSSALDLLSLWGLANQNLWLNLLNVCQITSNLLKVCFLYDSVCIFLVHLLFVFVAIIYTSLLLPYDLFP